MKTGQTLLIRILLSFFCCCCYHKQLGIFSSHASAHLILLNKTGNIGAIQPNVILGTR